MIVDYLYSHTAAVACHLGSWLEASGRSVELLTVGKPRKRVHWHWDKRVQVLEELSLPISSAVWFIPPPVAGCRHCSQVLKSVLIVPTAKVASVMQKAAPYAASVVCLSHDAQGWFRDNMPQQSTILALPAPSHQPILRPYAVATDRPFHLLLAAASHTATVQRFHKLLPSIPNLKITLLTRGPGQSRKTLHTSRRFQHFENYDIAQIPEILSQADLVLWQKQHAQDSLGLEALWLGLPVVSNSAIVGLDTPALKVVEERQLLDASLSLTKDATQLGMMQAQTMNGLIPRQQAWNQALNSLF